MPSKRRSGQPMSPGVKFVVCHDTANPNSTADQNVRYFNSTPNPPPKQVASALLFVDDQQILEKRYSPVIPEKAWHVSLRPPQRQSVFGYDANDAAIGVEYCYGSKINADAAYDKYVWVIAYACWKFGLDPRTQITGHCFLDPPPRKTDPVEALGFSRRTYDQLLKDIVTEYETCAGATLPPLTGPVGAVRVTMKANVRKGEPRQRAPVVQVVSVGTVLQSAAFTATGDLDQRQSRAGTAGRRQLHLVGAPLARRSLALRLPRLRRLGSRWCGAKPRRRRPHRFRDAGAR